MNSPRSKIKPHSRALADRYYSSRKETSGISIYQAQLFNSRRRFLLLGLPQICPWQIFVGSGSYPTLSCSPLTTAASKLTAPAKRSAMTAR